MSSGQVEYAVSRVNRSTLQKHKERLSNDGNIADDEGDLEDSCKVSVISKEKITAAHPNDNVHIGTSMVIPNQEVKSNEKSMMNQEVLVVDVIDHASLEEKLNKLAISKDDVDKKQVEEGKDPISADSKKHRVVRKSVSLSKPLRRPRIPAALAVCINFSLFLTCYKFTMFQRSTEIYD